MGFTREGECAIDVRVESIGESLKRMRELRELSKEEVGHRLRLRPAVIDLLESNAFPGDLHEIFARGYLKSYAHLLQFSEEDIKAMLASLEYKTRALGTSLFSDKAIYYPSYLFTYLLTGLIVLIMIALLVIWFEPMLYDALLKWLG